MSRQLKYQIREQASQKQTTWEVWERHGVGMFSMSYMWRRLSSHPSLMDAEQSIRKIDHVVLRAVRDYDENGEQIISYGAGL